MNHVKKFLLLITLGSIIINCSAQTPNFAWAKKAASTNFSAGNDIATDANGNSYIIGTYSGTISFGNFNLPNLGETDVFLAKVDAGGNFLWAKKAGGNGEDEGNSVAIDASGNCYISGSFTGSISFGSVALSGSAFNDMFLAKYDAAGNLLWAKKSSTGSGITGLKVNSINVDGSGNSFVTGIFHGSVTLGTFNLVSAGSEDVFVVKHNANGNVVWCHRAGGANPDHGNDISVDAAGNCYLVGATYSSGISFGNTTISNPASAGWNMMFLVKYSPQGSVLHASRIGNSGNGTASGIALDASGNIFVTGKFHGSIYWPSGVEIYGTTPHYDMFVVKYSPNFSALWAIRNGTYDVEAGTGIATDTNGDCYVTGYFQSNGFYFGFLDLLNSNSPTGEIFVAKLNGATGVVAWAHKAGGEKWDIGQAVSIDAAGNCYITGYFSDFASFGNAYINTGLDGPNNGFVAMVGTAPVGLPSSQTTTLSTYPNPFSTSFQISLTGTAPATATLTDMLGRQVHRQVISAESGRESATVIPPANLPAGLYLLQVQEGENVRQERVVRQ